MATGDYAIPVRRRARAYSLPDGAIGGLIAGAAMGMLTMLLFWLMGLGFWMPLKLIATLLLRPDAAGSRGFEMMPVLIGMMIHMALSMMFGAVMIWLGRHLPGQVMVRAVVISLLLWAIADFLVLPLVDPTFDRGMPEWIFAVAHLMYGVAFAAYLMACGKRAMS